MPIPEFDPLKIFSSAFGISSFAGLASLLRSGKKLTVLSVTSAMLNTGLLGLTIALLWYTKFKTEENLYFLIGVCVLAGLGGTTAIDFFFQLCKKGGLQIVIKSEHGSDEELPHETPHSDRHEG